MANWDIVWIKAQSEDLAKERREAQRIREVMAKSTPTKTPLRNSSRHSTNPKESEVTMLREELLQKTEIIKKLEEEGVKEAMNAAGFDILKQKDRFFIANSGLIPALRTGKMPNAVAGERRKFFEKNEQGVLVDFKQIVRLVQDFDAPNEVVRVLLKFDELRFESNKRGDLYEMGGELTFRDAKTNGLKQLIKMAQEIEQDIKLEEQPEREAIEVDPDNR